MNQEDRNQKPYPGENHFLVHWKRGTGPSLSDCRSLPRHTGQLRNAQTAQCAVCGSDWDSNQIWLIWGCTLDVWGGSLSLLLLNLCELILLGSQSLDSAPCLLSCDSSIRQCCEESDIGFCLVSNTHHVQLRLQRGDLSVWEEV